MQKLYHVEKLSQKVRGGKKNRNLFFRFLEICIKRPEIISTIVYLLIVFFCNPSICIMLFTQHNFTRVILASKAYKIYFLAGISVILRKFIEPNDKGFSNLNFKCCLFSYLSL